LTFSGSSHHFSDVWLRTSHFPFLNEFLYNGPEVPKHVADVIKKGGYAQINYTNLALISRSLNWFSWSRTEYFWLWARGNVCFSPHKSIYGTCNLIPFQLPVKRSAYLLHFSNSEL